jgi:hypothetical protein
MDGFIYNGSIVKVEIVGTEREKYVVEHNGGYYKVPKTEVFPIEKNLKAYVLFRKLTEKRKELDKIYNGYLDKLNKEIKKIELVK